MAHRVAVVDLGSNAARFLLARVEPGVGYRVLEERRAQTRLGAGPPGRLSPAAVHRTLEATHRFLAGVRGENGSDVRVIAVATAAVRAAGNRARLVDGLRVRDGVDLRILSGGEEARLGALAVMHTLPVTDGTAADLGGGSLQLTRLRRGRIVRAASLPLGTVYTTRRFLREDPPGVREVRALRQEIREQALGVLPRARRGDALVGLGGTVRALARLYLAGRSGRRRSRHGLRLRQADLTGLREVLERRTVRQRRRLPGLNPERADIILAGAVTLEELMIFGGYDVLTVCAARVHDGLLWREALGTGGRR